MGNLSELFHCSKTTRQFFDQTHRVGPSSVSELPLMLAEEIVNYVHAKFCLGRIRNTKGTSLEREEEADFDEIMGLPSANARHV